MNYLPLRETRFAPTLSVKEFAAITAPYAMFGEVDQSVGVMRHDALLDCPVCMGVKIAMAITVPNPAPIWVTGYHPERFLRYTSSTGVSEAARLLGVTYRQVIQLFQFVLQTENDPFNSQEWPIGRAIAWQRLEQIEHMPDIDVLSPTTYNLALITEAYISLNPHLVNMEQNEQA